MKNETKILIGIMVAVLVLLIGGVFFLSMGSPKVESIDGASNTVYKIDYSKGHKIGSDSAKARLVEFSDFQCPACKGAEPFVKEILAKNNPNLQFIYRNYPLAQHSNAKAAANAAEEAATQGKFWEMHDKLFETQTQWESLPNPSDFFAKIATELGLDGAKVKEATEKQKYSSLIQDDLNDGNTAALNATPTFYLNGKKLEVSSFQGIVDAIDAATR